MVRLGEISTNIGSGATPTGGEDSYLSERKQFALVRNQNVFDRRFDPVGLAFISDEQSSRMPGVVLQPRDLLLNITGDGVTFCRACAVPFEVLPACVNQHVAIVRVDEAVADPGYVLSYLTHPAVKSYIESFNAGGSRRAVTKGHIESFEIPLPALAEQRGSMLSKGRRHDATKRGVEGRTLPAGDVLVNSTGVGTWGRVAQLISVNEATIVDSHLTIVRANGVDVSWNYLGLALSSREHEIEALGEGSAGQTELPRARPASMAMALPPPAVMAAFDDLSLPFRRRIASGESASSTMAALRDHLLPKLISGEIRIKDAEGIACRMGA